MPNFNFRLSSNHFAPLIQRLRLAVGLSSCLYAMLVTLFDAGYTFFSPSQLLLKTPFGLHSFWQTVTAAFIIPYQGISLSMLFDLAMVSFFIKPAFAFVHSYLSDSRFVKFLLSMCVIGATVFYAMSYSFYTQPTSLASGVIFATIIFWSLLHYRGQSSLFLVFPIPRFWMVVGTGVACLFAPGLDHDWAKVIQILSMGLSAYLYGITSCRLRSHVPLLMPLEERLDRAYRTGVRLSQWYILRPIRLLKAYIKSV